MVNLCDTTEFSLLLFGQLAKSGHIKDCGDVSKFCNEFMEKAKEQGFIITRAATSTKQSDIAERFEK